MITIASTNYEPILSTLKVNDTLEQHSTCDFSIIDKDATYSFSKGQSTTVTNDDTSKVIFVGFVDKVTEVKLPGNVAKIWSVECIDNTYLVKKRIIAKSYE